MAINPMMLAQLLQNKGRPATDGPSADSGNPLGALLTMIANPNSALNPIVTGIGAGEIMRNFPKIVNAMGDLKAQDQPGDLQEEPEPGPEGPGGPVGPMAGQPPPGPGMAPPSVGPAGPGGGIPPQVLMALAAMRGAGGAPGGVPGGVPPGMPPPGGPPGLGPLAALMALRNRQGG